VVEKEEIKVPGERGGGKGRWEAKRRKGDKVFTRTAGKSGGVTNPKKSGEKWEIRSSTGQG